MISYKEYKKKCIVEMCLDTDPQLQELVEKVAMMDESFLNKVKGWFQPNRGNKPTDNVNDDDVDWSSGSPKPKNVARYAANNSWDTNNSQMTPGRFAQQPGNDGDRVGDYFKNKPKDVIRNDPRGQDQRVDYHADRAGYNTGSNNGDLQQKRIADKSQMSPEQKNKYWQDKLKGAKKMLTTSLMNSINSPQFNNDADIASLVKKMSGILIKKINDFSGSMGSGSSGPNRKVVGTLGKEGWR